MEASTVGDPRQVSFTSTTPGLIILLLDQSGSMSSLLSSGSRLSTVATAIVNDFLYTMVKAAKYDATTGRRKDYCHFVVLGYGHEVRPALSMGDHPTRLPDLDASPRGTVIGTVHEHGVASDQLVELQVEQPYWVEERADGERTEMAQAIARAAEIAQAWVSDGHANSFPPIILNVTDGENNSALGLNPLTAATDLKRRVSTKAGHALMFNCHLTINSRGDSGSILAYPSDLQQMNALSVSDEDKSWAKELFEMSSPLPKAFIERAVREHLIELPQGARGFLYNASPRDLIRFLRVGTGTKNPGKPVYEKP